MKIDPLGDAAFLLRELDRPAFEVAAALNHARIAGLFEAVASYDTVGIYVDPSEFREASLKFPTQSVSEGRPSKSVRIPVCYELGEDNEEVASRLALTPSELQALHTDQAYRCYAVGFCPGFAYLGYLHERLAGLPRKSTPRVRVEPGSVAITGGQTAVYPLLRPGGWWLIGRTPFTLVDAEQGYFPIEAGDEIAFYSIDKDEYAQRKGERL